MRGVGGPLLCIGDLLSDVGEEGPQVVSGGTNNSLNAQSADSDPRLVPSHLGTLFQETYDELDKALASTDKSWTALTLKLCTALESGNKLVEFANTHVCSLTKKFDQLERITKQADSAVATARAIQGSSQILIDSEGQ